MGWAIVEPINSVSRHNFQLEYDRGGGVGLENETTISSERKICGVISGLLTLKMYFLYFNISRTIQLGEYY